MIHYGIIYQLVRTDNIINPIQKLGICKKMKNIQYFVSA